MVGGGVYWQGEIFPGGGRKGANFQLVGGTFPVPPVGKTLAGVTKYGKPHLLVSETAVTTYGNPSTVY